MKYILLVVLIAPFLLAAQAENRVEIKSKIEQVKLYLTAGEIHRSAKVSVVEGRNRIVFEGISAYADPQSIQFKTNTPVRLVSTSTEMNFFAGEISNPRIIELRDSLTFLKRENDKLTNEKSGYLAEKRLLESNYDLGGNAQNLSVDELAKAADFYRLRLRNNNNNQSEIDYSIVANQLIIGRIKSELAQLNFNENERSNQVVILVDANQTQILDVDLSYMVSDCGWAAIYDLSADNLKDPISLKYKAQVYNNTGNEWEKVMLTLTTGDPNLSASHPKMRTWFLNESLARLDGRVNNKELDFKRNDDYRIQAKSNIEQMNQRVYEEVVLDKQGVQNNGFITNGSYNYYSDNTDLVSQSLNDKPVVQTKMIEISQLSSEFVISTPFSVPADAKPYTVEVKDLTLDATFSHVAVPKMDKGAFLLANITGWQALDLIPGPTNVYFGGNYVGMSEINTRNVSDTLNLSLGRDSKVLVTRELKKEFTQKSTVGNNRKDTYTFDIVVRNNREQTVLIDLFDQIPVSKNSDITVSAENISDGILTEENGEVKWGISVAPNQSKAVQISFTVKYPKDFNFSVKRYKTISSPRFY
ncbi:MAG: DUF4139 domain-containing protein [Lishizhenia sp.]